MPDQSKSSRPAIDKPESVGIQLLWYTPLCFVVVALILVPIGLLAFENVRSLFRHFTWGLLVSPSFYLFAGLTIASIYLPIALLISIIGSFTASLSQRFLYSLRALALIVGLSVMIQVVLWGSYPLGYDANGTQHLRLIPFLPWPHIPFLKWIWGN